MFRDFFFAKEKSKPTNPSHKTPLYSSNLPRYIYGNYTE